MSRNARFTPDQHDQGFAGEIGAGIEECEAWGHRACDLIENNGKEMGVWLRHRQGNGRSLEHRDSCDQILMQS